MAMAPDSSLAHGYEGVKVMLFFFAVLEKLTELMLLFGNGHLCPLLLAPASVEISGEEESEVSGALRNSGVQCLE